MSEVRFEVDGESVSGSLHEPTGPAVGNIVMVHGLLSQRREFADAPEKLAARGWRVLAFDQRGFGASGGPRGILTQERATADVLAAIDILQKGAPDLPTAIVGHSMGALFTLRALHARPDVRAGVLVAPMRSPRDELKSAEYAMYLAAARVSAFGSRLKLGSIKVPYKYAYEDLFVDPEAVRRAKADPFLHPTVDLTNVPSFLAMNSEEEARRVKQPVLAVLAQHDRAVKNANSRRVYEALAGPKDLVEIDSGHSVWTDRAASEALDRVDAWLRATLLA